MAKSLFALFLPVVLFDKSDKTVLSFDEGPSRSPRFPHRANGHLHVSEQPLPINRKRKH